MKKYFLIILAILATLGSGVYFLSKQNNARGDDVQTTVSVSMVLSNDDTLGFQRAIKPRAFVFPLDHGPHPGFKTEWWYFTGNLDTKDNRHFGYQLTIFRTALSADTIKSVSHWRTNQVYMGHFTLTDVSNDKFYSFERFSRGAEKLAGASASPLKVWLEDWEITGISDSVENGIPELNIVASQNNVSVNFTLKSLTAVILQGNRGLSQKGPEIGNASYYYSLPRLKTSGIIRMGNEQFSVNGLSWMDREWSTSALSKNQAGWDWFSLQLNDRRDIMYYQMRKKDGTADTFSNGIIVYPDGKTKPLKSSEVDLTILGKWQSPRGGDYPSGWRLKIQKENLDLEIIPYMKNQELNASIRYWEGAVRIKGNSNLIGLEGNGYVELTGYGEVL